uniref:Uncharacterized protein n=1 Tax=Hyaloperonospora arabidopsidis (strain Emoy2) TaxID=559515 RepID=M4BIH4_HYAAE
MALFSFLLERVFFPRNLGLPASRLASTEDWIILALPACLDLDGAARDGCDAGGGDCGGEGSAIVESEASKSLSPSLMDLEMGLIVRKWVGMITENGSYLCLQSQ